MHFVDSLNRLYIYTTPHNKSLVHHKWSFWLGYHTLAAIKFITCI